MPHIHICLILIPPPPTHLHPHPHSPILIEVNTDYRLIPVLATLPS